MTHTNAIGRRPDTYNTEVFKTAVTVGRLCTAYLLTVNGDKLTVVAAYFTYPTAESFFKFVRGQQREDAVERVMRRDTLEAGDS